MKNERYRTQLPKEELQKNYFLNFNPNYWMHKALALLTFIDDPSTISKLRFEGDRDSDQTVLENLKMELHMMVFHSAETLFLNVLSMVFMPLFPWIWISRCETDRLHHLINIVHEKGLSGIQVAPELWLRDNLYPSISDKHHNYEKAKLSAIFVVNYLKLLAQEYLDHYEYNSYKHGLRSFVGKQTLQVIDDSTQQKVADMRSDFIQFLEFYKKDKYGNPYIDENKKPYTLVKLATKGFDHKRDFGIIVMNSAILYDLFYTKKVMILTASEDSRKLAYYLFDDLDAVSMFDYDPTDKGTGVFKRFTI